MQPMMGLTGHTMIFKQTFSLYLHTIHMRIYLHSFKSMNLVSPLLFFHIPYAYPS